MSYSTPSERVVQLLVRQRKALVVVIAGSAIVFYVCGILIGLPDVSQLVKPNLRNFSSLNGGDSRAQLTGHARPQTWLPLDSVSVFTVCGVIKAEDRMFFLHHGIDWKSVRKAIAEAPRRLLRGERMRGASTLTQQLARTLYLSPRRTPSRKLREVLIARRLESTLTKRRILELYLNTARWADSSWGVDAGSEHYFANPASSLTPFQAVLLASTLSAPLGHFEGPTLRERMGTELRVLSQLQSSGIIDSDQRRAALVAVGALISELRNGASESDAISVAVQMEQLGGSSLPRRGSVSMEAALESHCGLDRELRAETSPAEITN